jgi:hypothetical protein
MKINISRQNIYLLAVSIFLLIFVFLFSFSVLIPEGKEYRQKRAELQKEQRVLMEYQSFHEETLEFLKNLQGENRGVITAFDTKFNATKFEKQHKDYFSSLSVSKKPLLSKNGEFDVYEVNTTSQISSPKSFYEFLEAVNKSSWIIGVNFPIEFQRDGELIKSSFSIKVYSNTKDLNKSL